jgi:copper chaperone CopZ
MIRKLLSGILMLGLTVSLGFAEAPKAKSKIKEQTLKEGQYMAKVKAIVCGGCGEYIQKAMNEVKGIESVSVDQEKSMVHFAVKKGETVRTADLQKNLKAWAEKMGMGADYQLSGLMPMKKMG